jgi:hypothetical protein
MTKPRLLLFDTDSWRLNEVAKELARRGHNCSRVDSIKECFQKMDSGGFPLVCVGRAGGRIVDIMMYAKEKQMELITYDLFDGDNKDILIHRAVSHIERRLSLDQMKV